MLEKVLMLVCLCGALGAVEPNTLTQEEAEAGFRLLFDGISTAGWTRRDGEAIERGWVVEEGALFRSSRGGNIRTADSFRDFELRLQWKVAKGSNSGIFWRAGKGKAHEMQVLDNIHHDNGSNPLSSAGASYALYPPSEDASRPLGEWNDAWIKVVGKDVTYWLNGVQVVSFTIGSDDWLERVANSKFKNVKNYGQAESGTITLQDHGDKVWYRSIRIRDLTSEEN